MMCAVLVLASVSTAFRSDNASAAQITSRTLTLQANGTNGASEAGVAANHLFSFTLPTSGTLGSIKFEYCTTATGGACVAPAGIDVNTPGATLGASTGAVFTAITNVSDNEAYISRTAAAFGGGAVTARLDGVINPTAVNQSFFVRISTYASEDTTGSAIDTGTVTASTATQIELTGIMPESIIFCTGATIALTSGVPDCTTATAGTVSFNQLFSPSATATATSQMAASTNATNGYSITVAGATLASGANTIPDMDVAAASSTGVGQFGLNLVENTGPLPSPVVGSPLAPLSNTTNFKAKASTGFDTAGTFKFDGTANNTVAASDDGGAGPSDIQRYTVSYIVNVSGSQVAGTYTTTLTYVCTAIF
jgi:hypothetical protein